MSDHRPDDPKAASVDSNASADKDTSTGLNSSADKQTPPETEWVPGEQLELIRIPPPTIWPATLALGTTGIAFGVVTHWILSLAGLFLFLLGAAGWIEDLRKDVLQ
jgi:hypothetical protein